MAGRSARLRRTAAGAVKDIQTAFSLFIKVCTDPRHARQTLRNSSIRRRLDPRVATWEKQIDQAFAAQDWGQVVELVRTVLRITGAVDTPEVRWKFIISLVRLKNWTAVDQQLEKALERHPGKEKLLRARAERAMMQRDYGLALSNWQQSVISKDAQQDPENQTKSFPASGNDFDWYELAWIRCAEQWETLWAAQNDRPTALMYRKVIQTLVSCGESGLAERLGRLALNQYPNDDALSLQASEALVRNSLDMGAKNIMNALTNDNRSGVAMRIMKNIGRSLPLLADIENMGATNRDEIRVLTAYRHTGADFAVRASNFWDDRRIHEEAIRLAKRDGWPEQRAETDLISARAWAEAKQFGATRAKAVGVSAPALARAVFHYFKQELAQKIPVDRIADEIAKTRKSDAVYIDLGAAKIPYLMSYPSGRMQTLYFYHALRKRGCNVVLVRFPRRPPQETEKGKRVTPQSTPMPVLSLAPQPAQLKPPSRPLKAVKGNPAAIVVPAGIRSVKRLLDRVDRSIVLNSGSAVKGFAYDRSVKQNWDYQVNLSLHSEEKNLLPTFKIPTNLVRTWRHDGKGVVGSPVAPSNTENIDAFLSSGVWDTRDWHQWLERAIVPYFRDFVRRTRDTLQQQAIMDAHIGDYLYAEPALVAAKVKDRGGRVHLWPHSTNPVHVEFHDPKHITSIHAVTRSGAAAWKTAVPSATVIHDPGLMLEASAGMAKYDPEQPLSIVVIGGRPIMRNLPIVDIAEHEDLYRRFFKSLEPLVDANKARVFFKPRGKTGEHEVWLERLVGRSADWDRVLEHPLRMKLPNQVFVSLSVGSSALLEGATRGVPGLIVREGFARDYLATDDGLFEILDVAKAVGQLSAMTSLTGWERIRSAQRRGLLQEITPAPHAD